MSKHFRIHVRHAGTADHGWSEEYTKDVVDPESWARETISNFNAGLRPGECARELLRVELINSTARHIAHAWSKQNLVTVDHHRLPFDRMQCTQCGITGKRYGLGVGGITRDSAFRAKVYARCDTTQEHVEKRHAKAASGHGEG